MLDIILITLAILTALILILWIAFWTLGMVVPFLGGQFRWETAREQAREEQRKQLDEEWRKTLRESARIDEAEPDKPQGL